MPSLLPRVVRGVLLFALLLGLIFPSVAQSPLATPTPPVFAASVVTVTDALGQRLVFRTPPQRIVSLAPSVTETLFALGLDREVVGISDADDFPPDRLRGRTRVGGVHLNFEVILNLRPDLVIGVPSLQRANLERLIGHGLTVLAVDADDLEQTFAKILVVGRATGRIREANVLVAGLRLRAAGITRQTAAAVTKPKVYIEIWNQPLMTAATGTFMDDLLRRAGGVNIFADLRGWPQVSAEAVISRNPDVIVLTYPNRAELVTRHGWRGITAVRTGRVHEVDGSLISRPGPRIVEGLALVARLLHPDRFAAWPRQIGAVPAAGGTR